MLDSLPDGQARAHVTSGLKTSGVDLQSSINAKVQTNVMNKSQCGWRGSVGRALSCNPKEVTFESAHGGLHNRGVCVRSGVCGPLAD